ncbi:MAG: IS110 family RNA-guided transposase [Planctomycetota bacterium]
MWYVGIDLHWRQATICVLDENGKRVKVATIRGAWAGVIAWLRKLGRPFKACFEASTGYGFMFDELSKIAACVKVAHPGHLRMIFRSKRKNDRVDAAKLAKLLYFDEIPEVHVPASDVRAWRQMITFRHRLVARRTAVKNQTRALLRSLGVRAPRGLWSRRGREWLAALEIEQGFSAVKRDMLLDELASLDGAVKRVTKELDAGARSHPGVELLMTIPGVGPRTAEAVVAWVDRRSRFGSSRSVGCYFGLVPSQNQSGPANRLGHITKQGPAVARKLLVEAAWQGIRRSARLRRFFERIADGDAGRRKIAIVATAHYLVRAMAAMMSTGEIWREAA